MRLMLTPEQFDAWVNATVPMLMHCQNQIMLADDISSVLHTANIGGSISTEQRDEAEGYFESLAAAILSGDPLPDWKPGGVS